MLQDSDGQIRLTHSVSAGLDYAAVGPEHACCATSAASKYSHVTDREAVDAFNALGRWEGILPALESAHAVAYVIKHAERWKKKDVIIINLSGRGDKDVQQVAEWEKKNAKLKAGWTVWWRWRAASDKHELTKHDRARAGDGFRERRESRSRTQLRQPEADGCFGFPSALADGAGAARVRGDS